MDAQGELYRQEAYELLDTLENALMELEQNPSDMEVVGRVFRAMHTIKGSGAMFGFNDISNFTHTIESVYDLVRERRLDVTPEIISLTLHACDQIRAMLDASAGGPPVETGRTSSIEDAFKGYLDRDTDGPSEAPVTEEAAAPVSEAGCDATWRIRFRPHRDVFANGTNPVLLLGELRGMGECSVVLNMDDLPGLDDLDPEGCYACWDMVLTTGEDANAIRDVFIFVEQNSDITIEKVDREDAPAGDPAYKRLGEILLERGDVDEADLEKALSSQERIGEILVKTGASTTSAVTSALAEQEHVRSSRTRRLASEEASSIRVSASRLDALVNLAGELVTVQARLSSLSARRNDADLLGVAEEVERLSAELRDISMSMRMLPIGTTFAKFRRLVRDLSAELDKDIAFIMEGEETELDKTVIERLSDPLVHLIRNSIDHGLEPPGARTASGKKAQGTIRLAAEHSGAHVLISITDDGAGLDTQAIRAKAVEKGIITPEAVLTEAELHSLIFSPGFSTASSVTSVSGRGVGMDVVRSNIEALGGTVELTSTRGKGTTVTLKLPLTLAIIDGLLVTVSEETFVLPLSAVVECVELTETGRNRTHGRHIIKVREEIVPYIPLRGVFSIAGATPKTEQVVITEISGRRVGFVVDRVIGQHQTVIKSLSGLLRGVEGISGATILGDGSVALIVDPIKLAQHADAASCGLHAPRGAIIREKASGLCTP